MLLADQMVKEGGWLFRWRSFLPLLLFVGELLYLQQFQYIGNSPFWDEVWEVTTLCVSLLGVLIRMLTVGATPRRTSGRNRRAQVADELNTSGMYSIVRNPLYLGNALIWLGMALFAHSVTFFLAVFLVCWVYHERIIMTEESFLQGKFGAAFREWAAQTPVFIPNVKHWHAPTLRFSFRRALRREYLGLFGVICGFTLLELMAESHVHHGLWLGNSWVITWGASLVIFLIIRVIAKTTRWLAVAEESPLNRA